ncbi:hypothetical protein QBC40DRAFT_350457 [Triangularia verruculosa]|uniref:DUF7770 domain-containing protein n=1 Tax=Triangularia verruculosa TaxID=2587418 RepID=A0AAN6XCB4_9PEZI|nr:hypothetical protein QBC40DRAFT_350457 [Triangularia verruculosa]
MACSSSKKSESYDLVYDTIPDNGILPYSPFLSWPVAMVHHDVYNLGPIFEDDGSVNGSKNHWVVILECPRANGQVRISMDSKMNPRHEHIGTYIAKVSHYTGKGRDVIFRQTRTVTRTFTVGRFLNKALVSGWHSYKMACDAKGAFKGCQHHLRTVTEGLIGLGWVDARSDAGLTMDEYLNYNYFINDEYDVDDPQYLNRRFNRSVEDGNSPNARRSQ